MFEKSPIDISQSMFVSERCTLSCYLAVKYCCLPPLFNLSKSEVQAMTVLLTGLFGLNTAHEHITMATDMKHFTTQPGWPRLMLPLRTQRHLCTVFAGRRAVPLCRCYDEVNHPHGTSAVTLYWSTAQRPETSNAPPRPRPVPSPHFTQPPRLQE